MKLIRKEDYKKLETYLKESNVVSNLIEDFPPICMQDPLDVRVNFILKHYETTGETIRMEDVPEIMYGGALPGSSKKKRKLTKEEYLSEDEDDKEASEPQKKRAKKIKAAPQAEATGSDVLSIQQKVPDLDPVKVLNKRTRGGKSAETSQPQPAQSIPKKKRKHHARKMKESSSVIEEEEQIEVATNLVTREVRRKKATEEATLQKAREIAQEIGVPAEQLLKESTIEAAQMGIELTKELQQLVVTDEREPGEKVQREETTTSEADASEGT